MATAASSCRQVSNSGAVVAVVEQRLVESLERGPWVDRGVFEPDLLDHVDHEVRRWLALRGGTCRCWSARLRGHRVREIVRERWQLDGGSRLNRRRLRARVLCADDQTRRAQCGALEEVPAIERSVACVVVFISHDGLLNAAS